ncbi:tetratricopeptide repeat protein [Myxococcus sp. K15C18031901]|uniref:tetratricopeptide repeat protein n=1 Tax=Myxococcus dinghuensis TaxID=2906761 RepID=UPI0020A7FBB7|nr:tetratricopeptide repeat protein [Myxococcus dinghuensis]MCP3103304.1 tetratricopeptide repeat protein [Myxococcus dinghuensis]
MGEDDFQCARCGLLLDPEQASGEYIVNEPSIVRALLSPPQRTRTMELPRPPPQTRATHELATARFTVPMDANTVPHLRAGLDIALQPLHPFEAHVASFVDGVLSVPELARAARLHEIEVKVVLKTLLERRVVELHRRPDVAPPRTRTDELPVMDGAEFLLAEPPAGAQAPAMAEGLTPMALGDEDEPAPPRAAPPRGPPPPPPSARPSPPRYPHPASLTAPSGTHAPRIPAAPPPPSATAAPRPATPVQGGPAPILPRTHQPPAPLASGPRAPATAPVTPRAAAPDVESRARPAVSPESSGPAPHSGAPGTSQPFRAVLPLDPPRTYAPASTPEDFLQRAVRLERAGEVERAIETLTRAIDRAPEAAALHSKLALILVHQRKDYARAARLLERAVELEPQNTVFQQNLLKVAALVAADGGARKERKPGLLERLTGKRSGGP